MKYIQRLHQKLQEERLREARIKMKIATQQYEILENERLIEHKQSLIHSYSLDLSRAQDEIERLSKLYSDAVSAENKEESCES